jgi:hypothetical protein
MLTNEQETLFKKLSAKRRKSVETYQEDGLLEAFIGLVIDTYRDSAHFVYELLQNADDAFATKAKIVLKNHEVLFSHNGTEPFTVSDCDIERNSQVRPGHINSITTFSLSTKPKETENKIGKFGIGFKSIFQYTTCPEIYNKPFNFRISNYMVPELIEGKSEYFENKYTTIYRIPFNNSIKTTEDAFNEISGKLEGLNNELLFLQHLQELEVHVNGKVKLYTKKKLTENINSSVSDLICIVYKLDEQRILKVEKNLIIQSQDKTIIQTKISIGFLLNEKGEIDYKKEWKRWVENAYCYFPTHEQTGLPFLIHAPFILTPNREGIKETRVENKQLLVHIGNLLAESIDFLLEKKLLTSNFYTFFPLEENVQTTFNLVFKKLVEKILKGKYIPIISGGYASVQDAYVCAEQELSQLLSNDQFKPLRVLVNNPNAVLVFPDQKNFPPQIYNFVAKQFTKEQINGLWFAARINSDFLKKLSWEWYMKLFNYLNSNEYLTKKDGTLAKRDFIAIEDAKSEKSQILYKAPLNDKGQPQIYLQSGGVATRISVAHELLQNEDCLNVLKRFELRVPNEFDDLLHQIIPKYQLATNEVPFEDNLQDVKRIVDFLDNSTREQTAQIVEKLQNVFWLLTSNGKNETKYSCPIQEYVYLPEDKLKEYFRNNSSIRWLDTIIYNNEIVELLQKNASLIKIHTLPVVYHTSIKDPAIEVLNKLSIVNAYSTSYKNLIDIRMDGLAELLKTMNVDDSIYVARRLSSFDLSVLKGKLSYTHYGPKQTIGDSTLLFDLKNNKWIFDKTGKPHKPCELKVDEIHENYSTEIIPFLLALGVSSETESARLANLNEQEKAALQMFKEALAAGLSNDEIQELLELRLKQKRSTTTLAKEKSETETGDDSIPEVLAKKWLDGALGKITGNDKRQMDNSGSVPILPKTLPSKIEEDEDQSDADNELIPVMVDRKENASRIESVRINELSRELELEARRRELEEIASRSELYSFEWFNALLELEDSYIYEDRVKKNPIRVTFSKAKLEEETTLILYDTPYIPQGIEDLGSLQITFYTADEKRTVEAEAVSPQKTLLKAKLVKPESLKGFDLDKINRAVVEVSSADFILEKLKSAFRQLNFRNEDNLKQHLPDSLKFIFGPPGTGKTTYISWLIGGLSPKPLYFKEEKIEPLMSKDDNKVLVLTPTNKAADVLVEKLMKNHIDNNDASYQQWLIRFGETKSEEILNSSIFIKNREVKESILTKTTFVTTIARYPYDFFRLKTEEKYSIKDFYWDCIIFDEASMINLASIIYVIYYAKSINPDVTFFIGGDPFQIHPVIKFEWLGWSYLPEKTIGKDGSVSLDGRGNEIHHKLDAGNIYSMVGLMRDDSFVNPTTTPHPFGVHNLIKQFRSVEEIGMLFSYYRYNGRLEHDRTNLEMQRNVEKAVKPIEIKNLKIKPITIIHFPVKKYGGIFRARSIKGSPYNIYSAVFTVELVKYIIDNSTIDINKSYKIGVICPYRIQETIINRLISKYSFKNIEIVTGTVHGFQGDECDTVIAVFNPSTKISRGTRNFLNKKNILNVAISRAKDNLIMMVPTGGDDEINVQDLHQLKWILRLARTLELTKDSVIEYDSLDVEKLFNQGQSIEDLCFSTTHQDVNIYAKASNVYEVRYDENAVDIQIKQFE